MRLLLGVFMGMIAVGCAPAGWDPDGGPAAPSGPPSPFIHQTGTQLVDGSGAPVLLRAVNLGGWLSWEGWMWKREPPPWGGIQTQQAILGKLGDLVGRERAEAFERQVHDRFITEADLARISALGFNSVRVPLNYRLLEKDSAPFEYDAEGWAVLDRLVDGCEAHGLVAILDLHSAPGGQSPYFMSDPGPNSLWTSQEAQDRTIALWRAIAERYRGRAGVGGYDLLNEPAPPDGEALFDLYVRIAAAIREVDPDHLVIVEGASYAGDFSLFRAPVTFNQAYSFHQYVFVGDARQDELDGWRAVSEAHGIPMWNGEFGVSSVELIRSSRELYLDPANGLSGFGFWTWKENKQGLPHLIGMTAPMPKWDALYAWITGGPFASAPSHEDAEAGMAEFVDGMALERCDENADMVDALLGSAP